MTGSVLGVFSDGRRRCECGGKTGPREEGVGKGFSFSRSRTMDVTTVRGKTTPS